MKRFGKRKLRLTMRLTVTKNGKVIRRTTKQRKTAIYKEIKAFQTQNPDKWSLCVVYGKVKQPNGKTEEITNSGEYTQESDLRNALSIFTEKTLLDDTEKWIGGI